MHEISLSGKQRDFISYCGKQWAIKFDEKWFLLKSGRVWPLYFDAGEIMKTAEWISQLTTIFIDIILENFRRPDGLVSADIMYGMAYKWIPLVTGIIQEIYRRTGQNLWLAFHRKETKLHGADTGRSFGMAVKGQDCLLVDDVLTAGTAARWSIVDIRRDQGEIIGMVTLFDRQEVTGGILPPRPDEPRISAAMDLQEKEKIIVVSAITFAHIQKAIQEWIIGNADIGAAMETYRKLYGVIH